MGKKKKSKAPRHQAAPVNPFAVDAAGGGVGPGHDLGKVDGTIAAADPVTGKVERMAFELLPGVTPEDLAIAYSGDVGGQ